jgi:hypothetical protein
MILISAVDTRYYHIADKQSHSTSLSDMKAAANSLLTPLQRLLQSPPLPPQGGDSRRDSNIRDGNHDY